jgi:hypothetical protein
LFPNKGKCIAHFFRALSDLEALHMKPKELPTASVAEPAEAQAALAQAAPTVAVTLPPAEATPKLEDHTKFPEQAKFILAMALSLKRNQPQLSGEIYEGTRSVIYYLLDKLLSEEITEPNNLRLANRMRKHRQAMLAFLEHVEVEPTNNLAERQIRPAVLQRKISAGNRSEEGAEIHSTLLSIFATAMQQGRAFLDLAVQALRNPAHPVLALSTRPP